MRYLSVCSGIEAATVAWHPLGWQPAAFAEIDAFPRAVLAHHHPDVPLHGDFTTIGADDYGAIDVLVGGTPCQSFSIAGLRGGLDDDRGNLALEFCKLARRARPQWVVWENVPGVLSLDGGDAFASILGGLAECGYGLAYRVLDAQYVRVDGFGRAVPQRRRRVFVVGYLGDWRRAAAVLFERQGLRRDTPPRRKTRQDVAPTISARPTGGGGLGTDFDCDGGLIASTLCAADGERSVRRDADNLVAHTLNGKGGGGRIDGESETFVAHALRAEGFDASEDGTGRGTPLVPICCDETQITSSTNRSQPRIGDPSHPLAAGARPPAIAIQERAVSENAAAGPDGVGVRSDRASYTLEARTTTQAIAYRTTGNDGVYETGDHVGALGTGTDRSATVLAYDMRGREGGAQFEGPHTTANIRAADGGSSRSYVAEHWAVRRLTPTECERLQGFPDGYTQVPYRGKPAADGPRYKALGNSMAVNVMRWIGRRIEMVEAMR